MPCKRVVVGVVWVILGLCWGQASGLEIVSRYFIDINRGWDDSGDWSGDNYLRGPALVDSTRKLVLVGRPGGLEALGFAPGYQQPFSLARTTYDVPAEIQSIGISETLDYLLETWRGVSVVSPGPDLFASVTQPHWESSLPQPRGAVLSGNILYHLRTAPSGTVHLLAFDTSDPAFWA